jgi:hypothetical protein
VGREGGEGGGVEEREVKEEAEEVNVMAKEELNTTRTRLLSR